MGGKLTFTASHTVLGIVFTYILQRRAIKTTAFVALGMSLNCSMPHFSSVTMTVIIIPMPQSYYED